MGQNRCLCALATTTSASFLAPRFFSDTAHFRLCGRVFVSKVCFSSSSILSTSPAEDDLACKFLASTTTPSTDGLDTSDRRTGGAGCDAAGSPTAIRAAALATCTSTTGSHRDSPQHY